MRMEQAEMKKEEKPPEVQVPAVQAKEDLGWRVYGKVNSSTEGNTFTLSFKKDSVAIIGSGGMLWDRPLGALGVSWSPSVGPVSFLVSGAMALDEGLQNPFRIPYGDVTLGFDWNMFRSSWFDIDSGILAAFKYPVGLVSTPFVSFGKDNYRLTYMPSVVTFVVPTYGTSDDVNTKAGLQGTGWVALSSHRITGEFDAHYVQMEASFLKGYTTEASTQIKVPLYRNLFGGTIAAGVSGELVNVDDVNKYTICFNLSWEENRQKYGVMVQRSFSNTEMPAYAEDYAFHKAVDGAVSDALKEGISYDAFLKRFDNASVEDKVYAAATLAGLVDKFYHKESDIWDVKPRETYNRLVESAKLGVPIGAHVCAGAAELATDLLKNWGIEAHSVVVHSTVPHEIAYAKSGTNAYLIDYYHVYSVKDGNLFDLLRVYGEKSGGTQYIITVDGKEVLTPAGKQLLADLEHTDQDLANSLIKAVRRK